MRLQVALGQHHQRFFRPSVLQPVSDLRDVLTHAELPSPYAAKTIRRAVSLLDVSSVLRDRGKHPDHQATVRSRQVGVDVRDVERPAFIGGGLDQVHGILETA